MLNEGIIARTKTAKKKCRLVSYRKLLQLIVRKTRGDLPSVKVRGRNPGKIKSTAMIMEEGMMFPGKRNVRNEKMCMEFECNGGLWIN